MANVSDKITDVRNAARPVSTTASGTRSAGGTSLACASLTGWPTASKVHFVTYKIDTNSALVAGTQLDCYGIVSGSSINSFTVVDGTDVGHAIGDVVEMLPTAAWGQDLSDALLVAHDRAGVHKSGATYVAPVFSGTASGGNVVTLAGTQTLTNKRNTKRTGTTTSSATPTINTDNVDFYSITAQTEAITSFTTNLSGTPVGGDLLWIAITGTAARAITWGASFEASTVSLPTTTVTTARLDVLFAWNTVTSKWRCLASS